MPAVTTDDPRSLLEASEQEELAALSEFVDLGVARVLAWCLEGGSLSKIGLRVHIAAAKLQIDPILGMTLEDIAKLAGQGRSAVCKHALNFTDTFGIRGPHDRSDAARNAYSEAWARSNGQGPEVAARR